MYIDRKYREDIDNELSHFEIQVKDTDLSVSFLPNDGISIDEVRENLFQFIYEKRRELEKLIEAVPSFQTSLRPMVFNGEIPPLALNMVSAANRCDVGPMAAVAGAFSEIAWQYLRNYGSEIIVENGGDIVSDSQKERIIKVFAGPSIFSGKIGIKLSPGKHGICTSSGTVGPSFSFGQADAVVIISKSASLADAAATAGGNRIQNSDDFKGALSFLQAIDGVDGILMIKEDKMLAWGNLEVVPLN